VPVAASLLARPLDAFLSRTLNGAAPAFDFLTPAGEAAMAPVEGVSWRVFANPVTVFIGGVAAVILELAEPRVRTGVWAHTTFRTDPVARMQRTGLAAMATIYGARSRADAMIARVNRMHARIAGETPAGEAYRADDPELLTWVQATAAFGFIGAHDRYVGSLTAAEIDQGFAEGEAAARAYGAMDPPRSRAEWEQLLARMLPRLEASPVVFEFLEIVGRAPVTPAAVRGVQRLLVRAAVALTPDQVRERLGLGRAYGLRTGEAFLVRRLAGLAEGLSLPSHPRSLARRRLGAG
jgi:uncharacterized protein (DUF2236 family)